MKGKNNGTITKDKNTTWGVGGGVNEPLAKDVICLANPYVSLTNCIIVCAFAFVTIYELLKNCIITLVIFPFFITITKKRVLHSLCHYFIFPFAINVYICMKVLQFTNHPCFKGKLIQWIIFFHYTLYATTIMCLWALIALLAFKVNSIL